MLSIIRMFVALLLASHAFAAVAQTEITEADRAALQGAVDRGQSIYQHDQAAWHTTDAMLAELEDARDLGIRGWIIVEAEVGLESVFYRPTETGYEAVWSGVYSRGKVINTKTYKAGERPFTAQESAIAQASKLPSKELFERCSNKPFNSVVLPTGKGDGSLYVYYLVPQESLDAVPLGGHYRFEVQDGQITDRRQFTNSCISLPLKQGEDGDRPEALMISHLLDNTPTEVHVFSMLAAKIPIFVSTIENNTLWAVESVKGQARVRLIEPEDTQP